MRPPKTFAEKLLDQRQLLFMSVPLVLYVLLFSYAPIWGWTMAFQNYKPARSLFAQDWAGLRWFAFCFQMRAFCGYCETPSP